MAQPPVRREESPYSVAQMFDRIAPRYDLLNRLLSGRRDVVWRNRLAQSLPEGECLRVLDLATGTADVLLALHARCARVRGGIGVDVAGNMLAIGRRKLAAAGLTPGFLLLRADATCLAIRDDAFDAVTIAFGIRNVADVPAALREMHRVLSPDGRALVLEFSLPSNPAFRFAYLFYLRQILPRLGAIISGDGYAYRYLNRTVEVFPYGDSFCALMREAGFKNVRAHPLTLGIATIYQGDK
jgi:demethylmenaquinone methyltransferase/2-methoxy-6-polyprenyl-1,4-benzoquinol methylase